MTAGEAQGSEESIDVLVGGCRRQITAREWGVVLFVGAPALLAVATIFLGGPASVALLLLMFFGLFAPIALAPFRRSVGVLRFRSTARGVEFPGATALRDAIRRASIVLLLGPLEGMRLIATGAAGDVPAFTHLALWFAGVGFLGLRRELRTWGAAGVGIDRDGVTASFNAIAVFHPWEQVPEQGDRPRALRRVLAAPPSRKFFPEEFLAGDPDLAARVIEFYRANPWARRELGTPAAVERLRRFDVNGHP